MELESAKRNLSLENALASNRLEGLEPDDQTLKDLHRFVRGEIDTEEYLRRVKERVFSGGSKTPKQS